MRATDLMKHLVEVLAMGENPKVVYFDEAKEKTIEIEGFDLHNNDGEYAVELF